MACTLLALVTAASAPRVIGSGAIHNYPIVVSAWAVDEPTGQLFGAGPDTTVSGACCPLQLYQFDAETGSLTRSRTIPALGAIITPDNPSPGVYLTIDHLHRRLFAATSTGDDLALIRTNDGALIRTISTRDVPALSAIDELGARLFVALGDGIDVYDTRQGNLSRTIPFQQPIASIAFDPRSTHLFVATYYAGLVMLDPISGKQLRQAPLGHHPAVIAVADLLGGASRVVVANEDSNTVSLVDADTGATVRTTAVGISPRALALDPGVGQGFVMNAGYVATPDGQTAPARASVSMLDLRTGALLRTIPLAGSLTTLAFDRRAHVLLVTGGGPITVLDTRSGKQLTTISAGATVSMAVDERTGLLFIAHDGGGVSVIDLQSLLPA